MNIEVPGVSPKKRISKKKVIKTIAICLVVALLVGGGYTYLKIRSSKSTSTVTQRTSTVTKGELTASITGSAPIESANRSELMPKVSATLEKINCKEGAQVKKGDVLFVLDDTDAKLAIENAKNDIAQMQLQLDSTAKNLTNLTVKAPFSGQVTNIKIANGDSINNNMELFTITDVSKLKVTLPFSVSAAQKIKTGARATVYIQDLLLSVSGKVTYISSNPYATASGESLYNVEISISNPGSLKEGMKATAEISADGDTMESVSMGTLAYANTTTVKSKASGTVTGFKLRENDFITGGETLLTLNSDDLKLSTSTNNMKMENLKSQLKIKQEQLSYYTISAPFDGTITSMGEVREGDTVSQGTQLAVVSDMNNLQFEVSIDELDISKVKVGQAVNITADALEDSTTNSLTGKVTKVAMEGTSSNGVTTYPVTVTVDQASVSKLKTGMNIDAEIVMSKKNDVLMVPLDAITKMGTRSFVYVKQSGSQSDNTQNGWRGNSEQRNWQRGDNSSGAGYGRGRNTSGSAMSGDFPQGNPPQGDFPQGNPPQGDFPQGNPPQGDFQPGQNGRSTSGGAMGMRSGNTSSSAVRGNFARAARNRSSSQNDYYSGAMLVPVETGISNDSYIEITSGLTEGQTVVLPKSSTASSSSSNSWGRNRNSGGSSGSRASGLMGGGNMGGGPGGGPGGGF